MQTTTREESPVFGKSAKSMDNKPRDSRFSTMSRKCKPQTEVKEKKSMFYGYI